MSRERPTLAAIIATLGPASDSPQTVRRLIQAGVNVFRLNFSHGDLAHQHSRLITVRAAARELGSPTAVLGDLQGPKIRVGDVGPSPFLAEEGRDVLFFAPGRPPAPISGTLAIPCTYEPLASEVHPGQRVLINDGSVRMVALECSRTDPPGTLRCRVQIGGEISTSKGINLPDSEIKASAITEKDWECVEWAVANGLDFLALSFVRHAAEVRQLRKALAGMCPVDFSLEKTGEGALIPIIAKIEKPQAVADIDAILEASDAIMVARGDLGVEMDLAQVPVIQKRLIAKAHEWGKPCIVATQMLETMTQNAAPTRAEASDVAHAIFDDADAVMLSGETAVGTNPVLVVETMRRIVTAAEESTPTWGPVPSPPQRLIESKYRTAALAHGAWYTARDLGAKLVVCWSQQGGAARYLSQTGMALPIIAYSSDERETRRMALLKGVTPIFSPPPPSGRLADWNAQVDAELVARGWAKPGDPIVLLAGRPLGVHGTTNTVAIHYIGNTFTGFHQHT